MSKPGTPSTTGTDPWRVRFGGQVYRVKDRSSLERLVETGRVPPEADVQAPGRSDWQPLADALGETAPAASGRDPWAAWDHLDDDLTEPSPRADDAADSSAGQPRPPLASPPPSGPPPSGPPPDVLPEVLPMPDEAVPTMAVSVSTHDDETEETDDDGSAHVPSRIRPPVEDAPDSAQPGGTEAPVTAGAGTRRKGNVIYFPGPRPGRRETEGATALDPARDAEPLPFPEPVVRRPVDPAAALSAGRSGRRAAGGADNRPRTNWWRVGGVAVVGLMILGGVRFYVAMNTGIDYGPPQPQPAAPPGAEIYLEGDASTGGGTAGTVDAAVDEDPVIPSVELRDPYKDMEVDLRSHMMQGLQTVNSADDLETALFMELTNVGLSQAKVGVNLLATVGDSDVPEVVEVRVQVRDNGDGLDRQIAAASLVVGKYVQHLGLTVPLFELGFEGITEGKVRKRRIDADLARQLFLARLRLRDFLAGLQH